MSTLDNLKNKATEIIADVKDKTAELADSAKLKAQELQNKAEKTADHIKSDVKDAKLDAEQKAHDLKYADKDKEA